MTMHPASPVARLRALEDSPREQTAYALTLLEGRHGKNVLEPALAVLAAHADPAARPAILRLYAYYGANKGVRDQGAYLRRALLDALRPIALPDDIDLLDQAVRTYEFWPPDFAEDAVLLRAAALVVLSDLDEDMARLHAARLLVDPHVAPMSGEPAVTAARVLGAQDELAPLWMYIFQPDSAGGVPEVMGECLAQMTHLSVRFVPHLIDRAGASPYGAVRLGLYHVLIHHTQGPQGRSYLQRELVENTNLDLFRYLAMTMVASGHEVLLEDLASTAGKLDDPRCLAVLGEAFDLVAGRPGYAALAAHVRQKLGRRR